MLEVVVSLQFNQACLGAAKRRRKGQVYFGFDRDADNRVLFLPSAWAGVMRYAAKLANKHHNVVQKIDWWPVVTGKPRNDWRRTIISKQANQVRSHYAVHEAFQPGDIIELFAVLPDEITAADFKELLSIVGKYKGFSPFNTTADHYGTFEILSVEPVTRAGEHVTN